MSKPRNMVIPGANRLVIAPNSHVETYLGGQQDEWFIRITEGRRREVCLTADEAIDVADFIRLVTKPSSAST